MRLIGLFLALILLFGGVTLAAIYPRFAEEAVGREIARLPLLAAGAGFEEHTVTLPLDDGQVELRAVIRLSRAVPTGARQAVVQLVARDADGTILLTRPLEVTGPGRLESPQTGVMVDSIPVGVLEPRQGDIRITGAPGPDFSDDVLGVELVLEAARSGAWPHARPVGIGMIVAGTLFLFGSLHRRRENPNSSPPPHKWGRR